LGGGGGERKKERVRERERVKYSKENVRYQILRKFCIIVIPPPTPPYPLLLATSLSYVYHTIIYLHQSDGAAENKLPSIHWNGLLLHEELNKSKNTK
jgi:hypothetical protein